jgi:anthranilate synthase component II
MILLIDNYDSFTFNLYQLFEQLGARTRVVRNDAISIDKIARLAPDGIVISPGPGNPDSSGISLDAIKSFAGKIPVLGVCLGHQAIGQVFGGRVVRAPKMVHGKVSHIFHSGKGIFRGCATPFLATRYHSLVIERKSLPKTLEVIAETEDGVVMGVRHRRMNVYGVQFHPESILTGEGKRILQNFLKGGSYESRRSTDDGRDVVRKKNRFRDY